MDSVLSRLKDFTQDSELRNRLLGGYCDEFNEVILSILNDVELLEKEEAAVADIGRIATFMETIKEMLLFNANTPDALHLFKDSSLLVFNWNNNTHNNAALAGTVNAVDNLVEGNLTLRETIQILKKMNDRMSNLQSWSPPAFEVSQHLMDALKKE